MTSVSNGVLVEKQRISSIDIVRGIVMVVMALDHVRDYFHINAFLFNPTDMTKTSLPLFITRWITHFCAPTFVLLSGVSARLGLERKSKQELSRFLLTRGLWLILLEITVVRFALVFNFYYDVIFLLVIWAIGGSMVILSVLVYLPERIIVIIGVILIGGHNALDGIQIPPGTPASIPMALFLKSGGFALPFGTIVAVSYALFPWLGILLCGYGLGKIYTKDYPQEQRRKLLLNLGLALIAFFIVLRFINVYGDPNPWSSQKNALFTIMSFLNTTKYPVSLLFASMALGPILVLLSFLERLRSPSFKPFIVLGRVPLFYFIGHFALAHILALILRMTKDGTPFSAFDFHLSAGFGGIISGTGVGLIGVYIAWIVVVLAMYPLCRWYDNYKQSHKHWWLSYL